MPKFEVSEGLASLIFWFHYWLLVNHCREKLCLLQAFQTKVTTKFLSSVLLTFIIWKMKYLWAISEQLLYTVTSANWGRLLTATQLPIAKNPQGFGFYEDKMLFLICCRTCSAVSNILFVEFNCFERLTVILILGRVVSVPKIERRRPKFPVQWLPLAVRY